MPAKILCATDGAEHSGAAVEFAADLAAEFNAPPILVAVNIPVSEGRGGSHPLWDDQEFARVVDSAKAIAANKGAADVNSVRIAAGDPAATVVDYAEKNEFDHIVAGRRGHVRPSTAPRSWVALAPARFPAASNS